MQLPCAIGAALVAIAITWQGVSFAGTTWDGGGANTNIDSADNWNDDVAPTLTGGSASLTFGTGGSTATINTNVNALGITINRDADFTIADGAGTLTLQSSGVTVTLPTTTARTHTISESVILGASQTWTVTNNVGLANLSVSGVISDGGANYSLTKAGSGVLTLSASNTYTRGTIISAGTVALSGAGRLAATGTVSLTSSGATFDISGANGNVGIGILSGAVGSAVRLGNNSLTISNGNNLYFDGVISGSGGIVLSSGILRLTGSSTYTGPTVVNGGILTLQFAANRLSPSTVVNLNGGQIDLANVVQNWAGLSGSAAANIYSWNSTAGSLVLTVASGTSYSYAGTLGTTSPGFSVVKNGNGTQVFTNAGNTYNQGTTLNSGTLGFANGSLGSSGTIRLNGGVLRWEAGNTQDVSARLALTSGSTATLDTNGNNVTLATGFGGGASAALAKAGAGTLTLSASNSHSGGTTMSAGKLNINNAFALGTGTFTIAGSGTIDNTSGSGLALTANNPQAWNADFTFAGTAPLNLGTGAVSFATTRSITITSSTLTAGGAYGGSSTLTKAGAGTLALTGVSTHAGTVNVNAGRLQLGNTGTAARSTISIASGAILELTGTATSIGNLASNSGNISLGNASLTINNGNSQIFSGVISGSGAIVLGSGVLRLTGPSTYTGSTVINAGGDLRINSDNSLATGAVTVNGRLGGSGILGGSVTINSGGVLAPGNSIESIATGALSFANGSTYEFEIDSSALLSVGADFTKALGNLSLAGTVDLLITDLAASPTAFDQGTTFSLVNYTGTWNNGMFTVGGSQIADGSTFTAGLNTWRINYAAASGGSNFTGDYASGSFVNIIVVPEPTAAAITAIGMACGAATLRRRRQADKDTLASRSTRN